MEARPVPPVNPFNAYDLLNVGYYYWAEADTEFPWIVPQIDLYARFVNGVGTVEVEVRIRRLAGPRAARRATTYGPHAVAFRPGQAVRDTLFRLRRVQFDGEGLHSFQLVRLAPPKAYLLATEYITIGRTP
jgi:hypothetical protein